MSKAEKETVKPQVGEWDRLDAQRPKIEFKENIAVEVIFESSEPKEYPSNDGDGVFYVFDVRYKDEKLSIVTSAWSLLKGLKTLSPLEGRKVQITKKLVNGKQLFDVRLAK